MAQKAEHSDLSELTHYVAVHPEDYARRWTLAKKLYMAWEYNDALKHLLILKKHWARRLNVLRYLAATYYRLGRYDEAAAELREITQQWPNEIAVWEQLAKVFEATGKDSEAAQAWENILRINPDHPLAARSLQRLRSPSPDRSRDDLRLRDSDSGIDLSPYRICANCGAQNSDEFERCWQCHALLSKGDAPLESELREMQPRSSRWVYTLIGGLITVAAFSASVYLTLLQVRRMQQGDVALLFDSIYGVLAQELLIPRMATFAALVIVWPISLHVTFHLLKSGPLQRSTAIGTGILLASVSYLAMWSPLNWLIYNLAAPAVLAFITLYIVGRESLLRTFGLWLVQGLLPFAVGIGVFTAVAGAQPILEFPAIVQYQSSLSGLSTPGRYSIFAGEADEACSLKWGKTGSKWLDRVGGHVVIEIRPTEENKLLRAELKQGDQIIGDVSTPPYNIAVDVGAERNYQLYVYAQDGVYFHAISRGVLIPEVMP